MKYIEKATKNVGYLPGTWQCYKKGCLDQKVQLSIPFRLKWSSTWRRPSQGTETAKLTLAIKAQTQLFAGLKNRGDLLSDHVRIF